MMTANDTYTEPTTGYWQDLTPEIPARFSATPPYRFGYPVRLPCGRILVLPLRRLPDGDRAVASDRRRVRGRAVREIAEDDHALVALGEPALEASLDALGGVAVFGRILQSREQRDVKARCHLDHKAAVIDARLAALRGDLLEETLLQIDDEQYRIGRIDDGGLWRGQCAHG